MIEPRESAETHPSPVDLRPLHRVGWRGALRILQERWDRPVFAAIASVSLVALGLIVFFIFREAAPLLRTIPLSNFFGRTWFPTIEPHRYGILPLLAGSGLVTFGALAFALPLGFGAAVFIAEIAPGVAKDVAKSALELLAGIPSVVYGFFGLMVVAPFLQQLLGIPHRRTAFLASVILGIMALPTVASLAEDALSAVPNSYREASMAAGATRWQTIWRVTFPAAFSGLIGAGILGMGRAVGETMAVLMLSGNAAQIVASYFQPVRTLTATIAMEMAETPFGSEHYHALFGIGAVLLVITLGANWIAEWFRGRLARRHGIG